MINRKRSTPYLSENGEFSDRCHMLARKLFYPDMFEVDPSNITFENTTIGNGERANILDGELAVDRTITVDRNNGLMPMMKYIQERFRRPDSSKYRDLTITEWNHNSGLPSELYKLKGGYFIYGYANHPANPTNFIEVVSCMVQPMVSAIENKQIQFIRKPNPRTGQTFICLKFDDLKAAGLIYYHYRPGYHTTDIFDFIDRRNTNA